MHYEHFTHALLCSACCLGALDLDFRVLEADDLHFTSQQKAIPFPWPCALSAFLFVVISSLRASMRAEPERPTKGCWTRGQHGVDEGYLAFYMLLSTDDESLAKEIPRFLVAIMKASGPARRWATGRFCIYLADASRDSAKESTKSMLLSRSH